MKPELSLMIPDATSHKNFITTSKNVIFVIISGFFTGWISVHFERLFKHKTPHQTDIGIWQLNRSQVRPLSVPFQLRTSGKGTDMATPLGPEKYGRIDFSLGRWTSMGQNAPKLVLKHAKDQVELVRIILRSLLRP